MGGQRTKLKPSDQPLVIRLEGQHLVIRIGIATLEFCAHAEVGGPLPDGVKIINKRRWAKDVIAAMQDEEEDGTTLINAAIDRAMANAAESSGEIMYPRKRKEGD